MSEATTKEGAGAGTGTPGQDFIRAIVADDLAEGRTGGRVVTRFPPEPNGFLHIGHASSVCLNFGIAEETGGACHLRFDDTNPETEDERYVDAIIRDVRWLGFDWGENLYFASDYFEEMYSFAVHLITEGKAYVESLSDEEIREYRGTVTEPGRPSPYRDRPISENLDLFRRMRAGEFPDGAHVLRAKMDLASTNMRMRDPILYRIRHAHHYRTGDEWCIYPLYDYAHPIEDALECVTHSICTLEFENNRAVYDWIVDNLPRGAAKPGQARIAPDCRPHQYEFARRNLEYTITSKRKMLALVNGGFVAGWDDPRMSTIAGLRRRGVTPEAIRAYADLVGVGKTENHVDIGKLEYAIRDDLNHRAPRVMCVPRPLRVVITNYPEDRVEMLDAPYFPRDVPREGSRSVPFSRVLYIDRDDFSENPPPGYRRLSLGGKVRLRYGYVIECDEVVRDEDGAIAELRCRYDERTRGGKAGEGQKVRGTIQWVDAERSVPCELRLYDRLFTVPNPDETGADFRDHVNPESLIVVEGARIEPSVVADPVDTRYQFERLGYFWRDPEDSRPDALVFNRIVTLRDTWTAKAGAGAGAEGAGAAARGAGDGGAGAVPGASRVGVASVPRSTPTADRPGAGADHDRGAVEPRRSAELQARRERFAGELGVAESEAEILTRDARTADLFEAALSAGAPARALSTWMVNELPREVGDRTIDQLPVTPKQLARLVELVEEGSLSSSAGREVLSELVASGEDPDSIVERKGLRQISDPEILRSVIDEIVAENAAKAAEYRGGRSGLLGFFVGQVMRRTGGRANPELAGRILQERLEEGD